MDEKTEELRDIFMDVADEETVTESQAPERGSLTGGGDEAAIEDVVARMREAYEFSTDLGDGELARVVRGFYEGESDAAIADALDVSASTVFRARTDLHLLRDRDTDAPFDLDALRELLAQEHTVRESADELGVAESTVRRYRRVVEAQNESRRVSERYRSEFEDALADVELEGRMTEEMTEDGLDDATEGMETDVQF